MTQPIGSPNFWTSNLDPLSQDSDLDLMEQEVYNEAIRKFLHISSPPDEIDLQDLGVYNEALCRLEHIQNQNEVAGLLQHNLEADLEDELAKIASSLDISIPWLGNKVVHAKEAIPLFWSRFNEIMRISDPTEREAAFSKYEEIRDTQFYPALGRLKEAEAIFNKKERIQEDPRIQAQLKKIHDSILSFLKFADDEAETLNGLDYGRGWEIEYGVRSHINAFYKDQLPNITKIQRCFRKYLVRKETLLAEMESLDRKFERYDFAIETSDDLTGDLERVQDEKFLVIDEDGGNFDRMTADAALDTYMERFRAAMQLPDPLRVHRSNELVSKMDELLPNLNRQAELMGEIQVQKGRCEELAEKIQYLFTKINSRYFNFRLWKFRENLDFYHDLCASYSHYFGEYPANRRRTT